MNLRLILAEDHGITRQGLRSLLEKEPDMDVVGEAENGRIAIELVHELLPDVLITDITMPNRCNTQDRLGTPESEGNCAVYALEQGLCR